MRYNLCIVLILLESFIIRISAQEIFFSNEGRLHTLVPDHFYLTSQEDYSDYITKDQTKSLLVKGGTSLILSRFYENSTIGFQNPTGILQIPKVVISEAVNTPDKGLTISGWLKVNDTSDNISIGFWGTESSNDDGVKVDIALVDKKIVIRKKSRLKSNTISPIIITDFTVDYEGIVPTGGDLTNGYFYFCIASDNKTSRVTLSRPGGRLYTRLYYVSLTDILTASDSFFWGRSPVPPNSTMNIPDAFDDIMVYNKYISAEENLNAFYIQSPLYPGVSYLFNSPAGYSAAPANNKNDTQVFNNDFFKWFNNISNHGAFSCDKWFIKYTAKSPSSDYTRIYFANARSGGNIYQQIASNYLYQLLEPSSGYLDRTHYIEKRYVYPLNMYDPVPDLGAGQYSGAYWFHSLQSSQLVIGWEGTDMYLNYPTTGNPWRVVGANKVYDRHAESRLSLKDAGKMYVMIKNYKLNKYMDIYWGGKYYYLILSERSLTDNNQRFLIETRTATDAGIYRRIEIKSLSGDRISPYWGMTDQKEDEHIIVHSQAFDWELVYVKDDLNNRPLYAIRANNEWGSYLLGYKDVMGTDPYYVCQASAGAYTADGSVNDNFLWSFEVHAGMNVSRNRSGQIICPDDELLRKNNDYVIYPNPTRDRFKLSSAVIMKNVKVTVFNLLGRIVIAKEINDSHEGIFDLSAYSAGIYTVVVQDQEKQVGMKVIKN